MLKLCRLQHYQYIKIWIIIFIINFERKSIVSGCINITHMYLPLGANYLCIAREVCTYVTLELGHSALTEVKCHKRRLIHSLNQQESPRKLSHWKASYIWAGKIISLRSPFYFKKIAKEFWCIIILQNKTTTKTCD